MCTLTVYFMSRVNFLVLVACTKRIFEDHEIYKEQAKNYYRAQLKKYYFYLNIVNASTEFNCLKDYTKSRCASDHFQRMFRIQYNNTFTIKCLFFCVLPVKNFNIKTYFVRSCSDCKNFKSSFFIHCVSNILFLLFLFLVIKSIIFIFA